MSKTIKRTDPHRPGAIKPELYSYCLSYSLATQMDGWPVPPVNVDLVVERTREATQAGRRVFGCIGKCGVCGAAYKHGDLWRHEPTDELVHVGHECAAKYELIADRRAHELEVDAARARSAREHEQAIKEERRVAEAKRWEAQFPGITEALQVDHFIINDIRERAGRYGVSEKQAALVLKLAERVRNPPPAERYVVAPTGKVEFEGEIVSVKTKRSDFGGVAMTVRVTTADGSVWLAWGTAPRSILWEPRSDAPGVLRLADPKGRRVRVRATLKPGREPHFAIMSRPRAEVLS